MGALLDHFGGPLNLRKVMQTEIVRNLQGGAVIEGRKFALYRNGPQDEDIRKLRKVGKRRSHVYQYERELAQDWWSLYIYVKADAAERELAIYRNGPKTLTINTAHAQVLVKVLQSVMASDYPEIQVELKAGSTPAYDLVSGPQQETVVSPETSFNYPYLAMPTVRGIHRITYDPDYFFGGSDDDPEV